MSPTLNQSTRYAGSLAIGCGRHHAAVGEPCFDHRRDGVEGVCGRRVRRHLDAIAAPPPLTSEQRATVDRLKTEERARATARTERCRGRAA